MSIFARSASTGQISSTAVELEVFPFGSARARVWLAVFLIALSFESVSISPRVLVCGLARVLAQELAADRSYSFSPE
jgi:hypothetical protein